MDYTFAPVDRGGEESGGTVMASLIWLLIPVMAVCIAGLWSSWATQRRFNGGGDAAGVAGYDAFRSAMERSNQASATAEATPDRATRTEDGNREPTPTGTPDRTSRASRSRVERDSPVEPHSHPAATSGDEMAEARGRTVGGARPEPMATAVSTNSPSRAAD